MTLTLTIDRWSAWAPGLETNAQWQQWAASGNPVVSRPKNPVPEVPDVSYMPAMLRRRLSPLARAAMHVAWQCLDDCQQVPLIFSSLYGESDRTFALTEAVAKQEQLSPASFSLSVHNAIAGQLSIARNITAEISCLSPLGAGVVPALLEAMGILNEGQWQQALLVFYDRPLPELYQSTVPGPDGMLACALLVSKSGPANLTLQMQANEGAADIQEQESQLLDLIRVLAGGADSALWHCSGANWRLAS
ncbi:beta-ketoacyl synthase chain length factor [Porticoccus sp. W117]|uniref:beta-ketoacyl synthase chain length factor n=1 Tax=Porticoccus sp. W117 TaxID=3054777 RepID=UPI002591E81B|nr:beta-ketoacyl synthase chain length factor [Porticoccus sp. W117]MDM3869860.1 beta-ketoacyl synthase chain length factor [Porticoccus sp. W117]